MLQFINEPVFVSSTQDKHGTPMPQTFAWQGRTHTITAWGRSDVKMCDDRRIRCHMVQTSDLETWELCQDAETAQWTLMRHWAARGRIV